MQDPVLVVFRRLGGESLRSGASTAQTPRCCLGDVSLGEGWQFERAQCWFGGVGGFSEILVLRGAEAISWVPVHPRLGLRAIVQGM